MAEKGAHLTQTVQSKPFIFDFVAHEALNDLLYPSIKKIIDFLALRNEAFINVAKWFDEYFLVSHSLLQLYYLRKYGATFSEKFYGLQRIPLNDSKNNYLGKKQLWLSLLAVSLFPYLKMKLNNLTEELLLNHVPRTYQLSKFIQHLKFLSGKTDINSPLLWAAGVKLKYADEISSMDALTLRNFIPQSLQRGLEISAFFIQFMQWWQTEKSSNLNISPVPPPPQRSENGFKYSDKCPICLKKRKIDTALSTSGFVFCFKCITAYLSEHNQCPVTNLPATVNNLIRIYPPTS